MTPPPVALPTGSGMTPQEQADKFMSALTNGVPADDDDDDDDVADKAGARAKPAAAAKRAGKTAKCKGKGKSMKKAEPKGKAKAKADDVIKNAGKKTELIYKPNYQLEATRSQFLCRPGIPNKVCGESSKSFRFADHGGKAGAEKAAQKWVKDFKATHKCSN